MLFVGYVESKGFSERLASAISRVERIPAYDYLLVHASLEWSELHRGLNCAKLCLHMHNLSFEIYKS